ncbi:MAG: hypothetical protein U0521_01815 [Anaerolineae bacterium]
MEFGLPDPAPSPHRDREDYRGIEDHAYCCLDGAFYMTYTAYGINVQLPDDCPLREPDHVEDVALLETTENKDHVLFPEKVNGRYAILHRRRPHIWIAYSDDLIHWTDHTIIMSPRPNGQAAGIARASARTAC